MSAQLSNFARSLSVETAFTVLALARSLKAAGKDVVELEIGDSPFDSTAAACAGGMDAIKNNQSHYCPSPGIPEFRAAAAEFVREEFNIPAEPSNVVAGAEAHLFAPRQTVRWRAYRGHGMKPGPAREVAYRLAGSIGYAYRQVEAPTGEKRRKSYL